MNKLKSSAAIQSHVNAFPGLEPARKQKIAEHLMHLTEGHHAAVREVLESAGNDAPETLFVRGCFEGPTNVTPMPPRPTAPEQPAHESEEHPGLPTAA